MSGILKKINKLSSLSTDSNRTRYDETFKSKLAGLDFETIENSDHAIFGLSPELELIYFNPAWFHFANRNGEPDISVNYPLGTSIIKAISGDIKDFYVNNYKNVLKDLKVWQHRYECSSADMYRVFYQEAYPLKNKEGIIIVNSLNVEQIADKKFKDISSRPLSKYTDAKGIITQCSNCRKTKRITHLSDTWDWVPSLVKLMPENVSHSICPLCYDYYWKYKNTGK